MILLHRRYIDTTLDYLLTVPLKQFIFGYNYTPHLLYTTNTTLVDTTYMSNAEGYQGMATIH
jgi:hypothetical protein